MAGKGGKIKFFCEQIFIDELKMECYYSLLTHDGLIVLLYPFSAVPAGKRVCFPEKRADLPTGE